MSSPHEKKEVCYNQSSYSFTVKPCDNMAKHKKDCVNVSVTDTSSGRVIGNTRVILLADKK